MPITACNLYLLTLILGNAYLSLQYEIPRTSYLIRRAIDGRRGRKFFDPHEEGTFDSFGSAGGQYDPNEHDTDLADIRRNVPGEPGIDYPAYTILPQTGFTCVGRSRGYYADEVAGCQVFHVCHDVLVSSFLCPIGSIFSQKLLTCDWWAKVDCSATQRYMGIDRDNYQPDDDEMIRNAYAMVSLHSGKDVTQDGLVDPDRTGSIIDYHRDLGRIIEYPMADPNDLRHMFDDYRMAGVREFLSAYSQFQRKQEANRFFKDRPKTPQRDSRIIRIQKIEDPSRVVASPKQDFRRPNEFSDQFQPSYAPTVPTVTTTTRRFYSPTVPTTYRPSTIAYSKLDQLIDSSEQYYSRGFVTPPTRVFPSDAASPGGAGPNPSDSKRGSIDVAKNDSGVLNYEYYDDAIDFELGTQKDLDGEIDTRESIGLGHALRQSNRRNSINRQSSGGSRKGLEGVRPRAGNSRGNGNNHQNPGESYRNGGIGGLNNSEVSGRGIDYEISSIPAPENSRGIGNNHQNPGESHRNGGIGGSNNFGVSGKEVSGAVNSRGNGRSRNNHQNSGESRRVGGIGGSNNSGVNGKEVNSEISAPENSRGNGRNGNHQNPGESHENGGFDISNNSDANQKGINYDISPELNKNRETQNNGGDKSNSEATKEFRINAEETSTVPKDTTKSQNRNRNFGTTPNYQATTSESEDLEISVPSTTLPSVETTIEATTQIFESSPNLESNFGNSVPQPVSFLTPPVETPTKFQINIPDIPKAVAAVILDRSQNVFGDKSSGEISRTEVDNLKTPATEIIPPFVDSEDNFGNYDNEGEKDSPLSPEIAKIETTTLFINKAVENDSVTEILIQPSVSLTELEETINKGIASVDKVDLKNRGSNNSGLNDKIIKEEEPEIVEPQAEATIEVNSPLKSLDTNTNVLSLRQLMQELLKLNRYPRPFSQAEPEEEFDFEKEGRTEKYPEDVRNQEPNFEAVQNQESNFEAAQNQEPNFEAFQKQGPNFRNGQKQESNFGIAPKQESNFGNAQKRGPNIGNAQKQESNPENAQNQESNFGSAQKQEPNFEAFQKQGPNSENAQKQRSNFENVQQRGPNFGNAQKQRPNFESTQKQNSNAENAEKQEPNFEETQKRESNPEEILSQSSSQSGFTLKEQILQKLRENFGHPLYNTKEEPLFELPAILRTLDFQTGLPLNPEEAEEDEENEELEEVQNEKKPTLFETESLDEIETPATSTVTETNPIPNRTEKIITKTEFLPSLGFALDTSEGREEYVEAILDGLIDDHTDSTREKNATVLEESDSSKGQNSKSF